MLLHVGGCCFVVPVPCSLVVTCWERADLCCVLSFFQMCPCPHQNKARDWRREIGFSPQVKYLTDRSQAVLLMLIFYLFSVLCLICLCARLFICALWSHAGKGLPSWLLFAVSNCEFVTFPSVSWVRCGT